MSMLGPQYINTGNPVIDRAVNVHIIQGSYFVRNFNKYFLNQHTTYAYILFCHVDNEA